ncbi:hypothetical protein JNUCC1_02080 [Lentibacillus sp. JNUCC-1]|uniref:sulfite exporter TauE/SafE family protein n=1 Tax=Lentibacillus sp. JNUCC-1 TaxID=2654513 RepID=UPI00132C7AF6|nr:sulfite exporter TauE/SafE family protein [Lentibacillus sp. JNUCC-1]MUV38244.1 hypothetical protein [Lentibacillus sp. JNUCC-1]
MDLSILQWVLLVVAAVLTGFNKTGVPTTGILIIAIMTMIFPAKEAVGIMLPLLLTADIFAVIYYRRDANKRILLSLMPWVLLGLGGGYVILRFIDNDFLRVMIGVIVLGLIALDVLRGRMGDQFNRVLPDSMLFSSSMGVLGGFTTMVGNAAGEVISIYMLVKGLAKRNFIGTVAWFFFTVNIIKMPLFIHLDMVTSENLLTDLMLVPAVFVGAVLGVKLLPIIPRKIFRMVILLLAGLGGLNLLIMGLWF